MSTDEVPGWLYGTWRLRYAEAGIEILAGTRMEFREGGALIYTVSVDGREARFELEYAVEGGYLRTLHPDGNHVNAARFARVEGGLLEFDFAGSRAWFARERVM